MGLLKKMPAEIVSSVSMLVPAAFAAMRAPSNALAGVHATAIGISTLLSIVYWSTGDKGALYLDRVAARTRAAVDIFALTVALTRDIYRSLLPLSLALLALCFYQAKSYIQYHNGDERLVSLLHASFHLIGVIGEIALIGVAYA